MSISFNLDGFMSVYKDYARSYLFLCKIEKFMISDHQYLVKSTKLPEHGFEEVETNLQGNKYKTAGNPVYSDFTITFNSDSDNLLRKKFIDWNLKIHDSDKNTHGSPIDYFSDITLKQLNGKGEPTVTYNLIGSWPKTIGEVSLDYSTKEISSFDVTFSYQYHILK